jgi:hypothetical protein
VTEAALLLALPKTELKEESGVDRGEGGDGGLYRSGRGRGGGSGDGDGFGQCGRGGGGDLGNGGRGASLRSTLIGKERW